MFSKLSDKPVDKPPSKQHPKKKKRKKGKEMRKQITSSPMSLSLRQTFDKLNYCAKSFDN